MTRKQSIGGVVHTYQKYDPGHFPSPTQPPPDLVSPAFEHAMMYGKYRELTDEELANAIMLDPSQIAGLGPSIDFLKALLEERKRKILAKYETDAVSKKVAKAFDNSAKKANPPAELRGIFKRAVQDEQIYLLERIYYQVGDDTDRFATQLVHVIERLGEKYQIEELVSKYTFTGDTRMTVPEALEIKQELEAIDDLLKQLEEAAKSGKIGVIDMDKLSEFASQQDMASLEEMRQQVEN